MVTLILKIAGIVFIASGIILIAASLLKARKENTFDRIRELRRIRETGYVKEHHRETYEDVYKRDEVREARMMSRRAKRVLERMEQAERTEEKPEGTARGTSFLEEVTAREEGSVTRPPSEEGTAVLGKSSASEENTGILPEKSLSDEGTAVLGSDESTGILPEKNTSEEGTAVLDSEEKTGILPARRAPEEAADDMDTGEGTDVLPGSVETESDAVQGEGTDVLPGTRAGEEDPAIQADGEKTDILRKDGVSDACDEEGTAVLGENPYDHQEDPEPEEEPTDVLQKRSFAEEATAILSRKKH